MMNAEFLEKLKELILKGATTQDVGGLPYSAMPLHLVTPPTPAPLVVGTLGAVRDYFRAKADKLDAPEVIVHVEGPRCVKVFSMLDADYAHRHTYLEARLTTEPFPFNQFLRLEEFIISLQARFQDSPDRAELLSILGNVTDGLVQTHEDDGVTQSVIARRGVALKDKATIPNPVILRPFRTFPEISVQSASLFIFRVRSGSEKPDCALIEADGGAWRIEAVGKVKDWLQKNLPEGVTILA